MRYLDTHGRYLELYGAVVLVSFGLEKWTDKGCYLDFVYFRLNKHLTRSRCLLHF